MSFNLPSEVCDAMELETLLELALDEVEPDSKAAKLLWMASLHSARLLDGAVARAAVEGSGPVLPSLSTPPPGSARSSPPGPLSCSG